MFDHGGQIAFGDEREGAAVSSEWRMCSAIFRRRPRSGSRCSAPAPCGAGAVGSRSGGSRVPSRALHVVAVTAPPGPRARAPRAPHQALRELTDRGVAWVRAPAVVATAARTGGTESRAFCSARMGGSALGRTTGVACTSIVIKVVPTEPPGLPRRATRRSYRERGRGSRRSPCRS